MLADGPICGRQTEARAARAFGREEGLEDMGARLPVHSHPIVVHRDLGVEAGVELGDRVHVDLTGPAAQENPSRLAAQGVSSVEDQVDDHLLEGARVAFDEERASVQRGRELDVVRQGA